MFSFFVIAYRDVLHPDNKFPHLKMLILIANGIRRNGRFYLKNVTKLHFLSKFQNIFRIGAYLCT